MSTIRLTQPKRQTANVVHNTGLPVRPGQHPDVSFVYAVYPRGWSYEEGYGFLPNLKKVLAKPGVNGVDTHGRMSKVLSGVVEKGGVVIQPTDARLEEYVGYVQYYDTNDGRKWYCDFCATATVLPNGEIFWGVDDENSMKDFRKHIRDANIVPMLQKEIFTTIVYKNEKELERLGAQVMGNPSAQAKYDALANKIVSMNEWWKTYTEGLTKSIKPKKKSAPKKRTATVEL